MVKKMLYVVVTLLIVVTVSGCLELSFNAKSHVALGVPKGKITEYFKWEDSRYESKEVVNPVPVAPVIMVTSETIRKTKTVPVFNSNDNTKFVKFGDN